MFNTFKNINEIKKFLEVNILEDKVLLVNTKSDGDLILNEIVRKGGSYFNIEVKTTLDMAKEVFNNGEFINSEKAIYLMEQALKKLKESKDLLYFNDMNITREVSEIFYDTYKSLNHNMVEKFDIQFLNGNKKFKSIEKVINLYNEMLRDKNYIDEVKVYKTAILQGQIDIFKNKEFIILDDIELTKLENKFLKICFDEEIKASLLKFEIDNVLEQDIEFFCSYGKYNEIYNVIREVKKRSMQFEDVLICASNVSSYTDIVYEIGQELDIPITFSAGISIKYSIEARFILAYFDWIFSNYCINEFYKLAGYLKFDEINIVRKCLSDLEIKFVKRDFEKRIDEKLKEVKDNDKAKEFEMTKEFIFNIVNYFDGEKISYSDFNTKIITLILELSKRSKQEDEEIIEEIKKVGKEFESIEGALELDYIILNTRKALEKKKIFKSVECEGKIHFTSIDKGWGSNRKNCFITGLNDELFFANITKNIILLDSDCEKLNKFGNEIKLIEEKREEKKNRFIRFILDGDRKWILSFNAYEVTKSEKKLAVDLFLEIVRIKKNDSSITYDGLEREIGGAQSYIAEKVEDVLTVKEEALYYKIRENKNVDTSDLESYKEFCNAFNKRKKIVEEEKLCEYEGVIKNKDNIPKITRANPISATAISKYMECPYGYFLKYILGIKELKESIYDVEVFLNSLEVGNLIHKIFELFYKKESNRDLGIEDAKAVIAEILNEEFLKGKIRCSVEKSVIVDIKEKILKKTCNDFIENEIATGNLPKVLDVEYNFGICKNKAKIKLKNGKSMYLIGKIDRIDKVSNSEVNIIDYKTGKRNDGSTKVRNKNIAKIKELKSNNIQIVIYKICYELLSGKVNEATYYYTSEKEKYIKSTIEGNLTDKCIEILTYVDELISNGVFIKCSEKTCGKLYCDYKGRCKFLKDYDEVLDTFKKGISLDNFGGRGYE